MHRYRLEARDRSVKLMRIKTETKRILTQIAATLGCNPHLSNFLTGTIYTGKTKLVCAPGLNCYSCPAAGTACPIGALQTVEGSSQHSFPALVTGFLLIVGGLIGRFVCGFLCAFGFLQDLLYKIPVPKLRIPEKPDRVLRYLKYVILVVFVIALPLLLTDKYGMAPPYFCKYICPAGTLEAGIPLVIKNESLRTMLGAIFNWKVTLAVIFVISSMFIYRPFCKYICPLGAIYSLFNKVSILKLDVDHSSCVNCGACKKACHMGVDVINNINGPECIRCGKCKTACNVKAINWKVGADIKLARPETAQN